MSVSEARSVIERIAVILYDRLNVLTTGIKPTAAIREVVRPTRLGGYTPQHMQIVLVQNDPVENEELFRPGNPPAIAFDQQFDIHCHLLPSEIDPTPIDEYINTLQADVVEAITDAGSRWFTFGNLAVHSQWGAMELIQASGSIDGFMLPLTVTYRTSEWTPYQVRV